MPARWKTCLPLLLTALVFLGILAKPARAQKKDYLSDAEAEKIRDAGATGPRIKLFASFAEDRINKLKYVFAHMDPKDPQRPEELNTLLNGYIGCVDEAADLVDIGIEKQENIKDGVNDFASKLKEFLPYLEQLEAKGPDLETYKDGLDDALAATRDATKDVQSATHQMAPPPVRRRPQ